LDTAFASHDVDETIGFNGKLGIEEAFRLHHDDSSLIEPGQERTISVTNEKRELQAENIKVRWR
jgi:hypothetical protein